MQLLERVKNCNGCGACIVPCKHNAVSLLDRSDERITEIMERTGNESKEGKKKAAHVNEGACDRCNACVLFCPLFNPVEIPKFDEWYEFDEAFDEREMHKVYRETMRKARSGQHTEFVGTLCQIAALKSLNGDKIPQNLIIKPLVCKREKRESEACCRNCAFY